MEPIFEGLNGLLKVRALIKDSIKNDYSIIHYIAYDFATNLFELTIASAPETTLMPNSVCKLMVPYSKLERVILLFKKMIDFYEKKGGNSEG